MRKITDLGEEWEKKTKCPIPLGGIVLKRNLDNEIQRKVNRVLKRSIEFAFANPQSGYSFVKKNAQELDDEVIWKHIDLYVNSFTVDLGKNGKKSVNTLFRKAAKEKIINKVPHDIFVV